MNIQQFKRPWKDYNFRYLYEDLNGGRRIKDDGILRRKNLRTPARSSLESVWKISNIAKMFHYYLQKVLG